ncbi:putative diguanylate cyclase YdaM [Marinomonas spartinae]|uniref:GGDEF domain-containing protein n=1 Tax=Marinomonas spartinae TaxID=1792290 RepID=UPI00080902B3|nr:GGDEF domain-containing protein [Marinomonas spartinae]SBS32678.1 putative diguanylate cyclase YdaM [Marinomonas spartinae]
MTKCARFTHFVVCNILGCYVTISVIVYGALLFAYHAEVQEKQKRQVDNTIYLLIQQIKDSSVTSLGSTDLSLDDSGLFFGVCHQLDREGVKGIFLQSADHYTPILDHINKETSALETWVYPFSVRNQSMRLSAYVSNDKVWRVFIHRLLWYMGLLAIQTAIIYLLLYYFVVRGLGMAVSGIQQELSQMNLDDPKRLYGNAKFLRFLEYQWILNGMNKIIHGLAASRRELSELNSQLEEKVAQKTQSLEEKNMTLVQLNKKLYTLANTDSLTQVYNRTRFDLLFREHVAMAEYKETYLSLLLIDLDNFKRVNDQFGHQVGDHVLYVTAKLLESVVMNDGIVARWGGEEFAVLLPHIAIDQAQHIAETLRQHLEEASFDDPAIHITMSVGVSQLLLGESGMSLLKRTDAAMYQAKNTGRNQVIVDTGPDEKGIS